VSLLLSKVLLGLDIGAKRIGVARTDELGFMAHPLEMIERHRDQDVIDRVQALIKLYSISEVVVGLPYTLKGEIGPKAKEILVFVDLLKQYIDCPISTWDERFTTQEAEEKLLAHDVSRRKRKKKIDALAAEIMLQSYLNHLKSKGRNQ